MNQKPNWEEFDSFYERTQKLAVLMSAPPEKREKILTTHDAENKTLFKALFESAREEEREKAQLFGDTRYSEGIDEGRREERDALSMFVEHAMACTVDNAQGYQQATKDLLRFLTSRESSEGGECDCNGPYSCKTHGGLKDKCINDRCECHKV